MCICYAWLAFFKNHSIANILFSTPPVTLLHDMSNPSTREVSHSSAIFLHKLEKHLLVSPATVQEQPPRWIMTATFVNGSVYDEFLLDQLIRWYALCWYPPSDIPASQACSFVCRTRHAWCLGQSFTSISALMGLWAVLPWLVLFAFIDQTQVSSSKEHTVWASNKLHMKMLWYAWMEWCW